MVEAGTRSTTTNFENKENGGASFTLRHKMVKMLKVGEKIRYKIWFADIFLGNGNNKVKYLILCFYINSYFFAKK